MAGGLRSKKTTTSCLSDKKHQNDDDELTPTSLQTHLEDKISRCTAVIPAQSILLPTAYTANMFRSAVIRSLRTSVPRVARVASPVSRQAPVAASIARQAQFAPRFAYQAIRQYSAPAGLSEQEVQGRIIDLLKNFDNVRLSPILCL